MKSLNIKIPLSIAEQMSNGATLNPSYITSFIVTNLHQTDSVLDSPIKELSYNYTFKVPADLHTTVKLKSVEKGLPMNELVGRLLSNYYEEWVTCQNLS